MEEKVRSGKGAGRGATKRSQAWLESRGCSSKSGDPSKGEEGVEWTEELTLQAMGGRLAEMEALIKSRLPERASESESRELGEQHGAVG